MSEGLIERVRTLLERAAEPCPKPLPEQDCRVGEVMAARQDDENRRRWGERVQDAVRELLEVGPEAADALGKALEFVEAAAKLPCETSGNEDMESGCCGPCRARTTLSSIQGDKRS